MTHVEEQRDNSWREYDSVCEWCAKRGIEGEEGDPLPELISTAVGQLIDADREAFMARVKAFAYALAMDLRKS